MFPIILCFVRQEVLKQALTIGLHIIFQPQMTMAESTSASVPFIAYLFYELTRETVP